MKKTLICALVCAPLFVGCVSTTDKSAGTLDRTKAVAELTTKMDELGYKSVQVQPGVDEFLNMAAIILKRQRNVMSEYRTQTEHFTDVQAFLYAHKGKTPEQLKAAILEFDAGAKNESEKIGHKIDAYTQANEKVYDQNVELATSLTVEIAKSAIILTKYNSVVVKAAVDSTVKSTVGSLFSALRGEEAKEDPNDLGSALLKAKDQLDLALQANDIIDLEQATITAVKKLQEEQEAKS